ncbi:MAG TPA: thioredoxin-disulfide reductase [Thermoleophilaceae bacterium]|nr:thioredoxin-disulfide reductase [Thermoleophilaceae bacterium]
MSDSNTENLVIVGSGPAGYTAALYAARADLQPLVIEGFIWGGLLQQTTDVENYPGYPEGIMGPEMMQQFRDQAERFGTRFVTEDATSVELAADGGVHRVLVGDREHRARAVVLAMGAAPRKLGVPGEEELSARGVSYCATCDAAFFRDKPTIVVGGGDTAMEDAIFLSKFASDVKVVHRRDEFRASAIMVDRARSQENIELLTPYVVERFEAGGDGTGPGGGQLGRVVLTHAGGGADRELEIDGAFIAIGHTPNSEIVLGQVDTDDEGYVITEPGSTRTRLPGVFAAGDLVDHTYRQAVTAAGSGCQAALDAEWYLRDAPPDPVAHWAPDPDRVEEAAEAAAS